MHTIFGHVRFYIRSHDDLPAFHAGYLVLSVLAAFLFSTGVFAVLVAIHILVDVWKYHLVHGESNRDTVKGVIRENIVDVMLLVFALGISVVFHRHVGVALLSGLYRVEFAFVRLLGTVLPKIKIFHSFVHKVVGIRYSMHAESNLSRQWSHLEVFCFLFILASIGFYLASPWILGFDIPHINEMIMEEMRPRLL